MRCVPSTTKPRILFVCLLFFAPLAGGACNPANVAASGGGTGGSGTGGSGTDGSGIIIGALTDGGASTSSGSPMTCDATNYGVMFTKGECPHDCNGQASNTYISGKVYDPAGKRTIYGAVVYIPSNPSHVVDPMPFTGVQCTTCTNFTYDGPPVPQAHAVTDPDGSFKIGIDPSTGTDWAGGNPVPVGSDIPLVIQIGKWRRMVTIAVAACQDNQIDKSLTSLPSSRGPNGQNGQGSLPRIAISVGDADRLQCLFARMGIAASEFTSGPTGTGAINLYEDDTASFTGTVSWPSSTTLWDTADHLNQYDIIMLGCQGSQSTELSNKETVVTDASKQAMVDYANAGGKIFAEHYQQTWLASFPPLKLDAPTKAGASCLKDPICTADMATVCAGNSDATASDCQLCSFNCTNLAVAPYYTASAPFGEVANWIVTSGEIDASGSIGSPNMGAINTTFPSGAAFAQWLTYQPPSPAVSTTDPQGSITIESEMKPTATATIDPPATTWISIPGYADYFTFNTPVNQAEESQCGRFAYTDVHVASGQSGTPYYDPKPSASPSDCLDHELLNQEKAIEFMIFDLSHCTISDSNDLGSIVIQ